MTPQALDSSTRIFVQTCDPIATTDLSFRARGMLLYNCVHSAQRARCAPGRVGFKGKGRTPMLNTIGQRESLALALAAGARLDKYVDDDEGKAMANVVETVKTASCGLVDHMCAPAADEASQAGANGVAPGAN